MQRFTRLITALADAADAEDKAEALARYFREAPPGDAAWALALLLGRRLPRAVSGPELRELAAEASGYPEWLVDASIDAAGDVSEAVALLVPEPGRKSEAGLTEGGEERTRTSALPSDLQSTIDNLQSIRSASEDARRSFVLDTWNVLDPPARLVFNKLATGELRAAVSRTVVARGLAAAAGVAPAEMAHRLAGDFEPTAAAFTHLMNGDHSANNPGHPYPFALAGPLVGPPEAMLGSCAEWQAEWHYDGVRAQLLRRNGCLMVWSRAEELLTGQCPELADPRCALPEGTVLDGVLLACDAGSPLPLDRLRARLNRKPSARTRGEAASLAFMAFDLLELAGADLRTAPLAARRRALEDLFAQISPTPDAALRLAPVLSNEEGWPALERRLGEARAGAARGLILKRLDAPYRAGRAAGDWWKWPADLHAIDAVLLYAQRGLSGLHNQFTLGVWSGGLLVPVAKAEAGFAPEDFQEIEEFIRGATVEKHGPVRVVRQELVFELAFEAVVPSARHKAGLTLRAPRVVRWRRDAQAGSAGDIATLRKLLP